MPLGYSEMDKPAVVEETTPAEPPTAEEGVVTFSGASDDLVQVEGTAQGCGEYLTNDAHFMVTGEATQTRVRVWFTKNGLWAIAGSQAAEGMEVLPVEIQGGSTKHSVRALVKGVRLVIHEQA